MAKIKGRFAPLTEELGNDERFINDLTDLQKLVFLLILYTSHMTHHKAPANPNFYRLRYGLKAPNSALKKALEQVRTLYPNIRISLEHGKEILSFVKSTTYENEIRLESESEVEEEQESESDNNPDGLFNFTEEETKDIRVMIATQMGHSILGEANEVAFKELSLKLKKAFSHGNIKNRFSYAMMAARNIKVSMGDLKS